MKKLSVILLLSLLLPFLATAQEDTAFTYVKTISGDITSFTVDNLDNIYLLNSKNQVRKLDINGDSAAIFNDVRKYGKVSMIDVSNPLKVLLYYKDFATLVMLDRFLNIRNSIDLRKQNIYQAKAISQSFDNKVWVFDELESKLKKLDEDGKLLQETPDFRLLLGKSISPVRIFDENMFVYLYDPVNGIYVFDYFGALKNNILIQQWQNLKVTGKYIYGSKEDTLYRYEISTFRYDEWKMPAEIAGSKAFNFTATRLYALKDDSIRIYSIR
ncbi:MAG: hypothetical protein JNM88_09490 [Chitinophagaceae bacterium]|nr:hypothetical protein [Chitinophagaceae bacterium]